jgi:hypothetical protein
MASEHISIQEQLAEKWHIDDASWQKVRNVIMGVMLVGWVGCIAGFFLAPRQVAFPSYLLGFCYATLICLGALFFTQVMYLTGSAWSVTVRRFAEHLVAALPYCAVLFIPLLFGIHDLYEWSHTDKLDDIITKKASYLNQNFFIVRTFIYFAIWSFLAWKITGESAKQDHDRSIEHMNTASRFSAPGLMITFLTVSLAAFDWLMSLSPHWYSTIFGIYVFVGGAWTFMATMILICLNFRKNGWLVKTINVEHYHDLGKWQFALTNFWAYIGFSQYMLIWYANLPEETEWFKVRWDGSWAYLSYLLIFGHFLFPFLTLLPRASKRNLTLLGFIACWVYFIEFVDLYWLIFPNFDHHGFHLHPMNLFGWLAPVSTVAFVFWNRLKKHALLPIGDLRLEQGLTHQNL